MRRNPFVLAVPLAVGIALLGVLAIRAPRPVDAQAPLLDQLDRQLLELAFDAHATAQRTCETQPDTKHSQKLSSYVESMIKVKYPGYVIDWNAKTLKVAK